jgi:hypothetical protein
MNGSRGRPFEPGNKMGRGRPKGSRNKRTAKAQEILDQYSEPLMKKCVAKALEGDVRALSLCLERILPSPREPGVRLKIPKLTKIEDIDVALEKVVDAIANGHMSPSEGEKFHALLQNHRGNIESRAFGARITELEKIAEQQNPISPKRRDS